MKKKSYKIASIFIFSIILVLINKVSVLAASADISASNINAEVGDDVSINVTVDAVTWNIKVNGSGVSDSITGYDMDGNKITNKSYKLDTSKPGTYTVKLSGDATDANGTIYPNKEVTVNILEKKSNASQIEKDSQTPTESNNATASSNQSQSTSQSQTSQNETKAEPDVKFAQTNQTLYSTGEINVTSSYSTSSNVVGSLKKGDTIEVIGTSSNGWSKVKYNGKEAYIKTELLTETKPKEEKSTNKLLKSLKIEEANLNPEFDKDVTNYTLKIGKDVNSLKIEAVAEDDKSQVSISGNEDLKNGENTVKITVTAEDGTIRTYTITVTKDEKDESEKLKLASLKITGITFSDKFDPDKYEYKLNLNYKLEKLDIKAEANKADAKIEILGNDKLSIGENIITIMVKSKDESENITYQIIVNMQEGSENDNNTNLSKGNKNKTFLYITIGVFSISLLLIILIIVRGIRKSREEEFDEEYDNEDNDYSGYNYNNNYTEELYGIKNEKNKENNLNTTKSETDEFYENLQDTSREDNRLYDVENEIDFSDIDKPNRKKGGKHSR